MQTRQKFLSSAVLMACGAFSSQLQAALPVDAVLLFNPGVRTATCSTVLSDGGTSVSNCVHTGSWFGMDLNPVDSAIDANTEYTRITRLNGLRISTAAGHDADVIQLGSGTHQGAPNGTENANIDQPWGFSSNTGLHYTVSAIKVLSTTSNTATLDFSGWRVSWSGTPIINMGARAWNTPNTAENFTNGQAKLTCATDCALGDTFTLDYHATVPTGDPSGFDDVHYAFHLEGTIGGFNSPPVTTALVTGVLSTTAVPTAGTAVTIDLTKNVSDTVDFLTNDNLFTGSTPVISNPSGSIASTCTPTTVTANSDGTVTFPACPNGTYTFQFTFADAYETSNVSTVTVTASGDPAPNASPDSGTTDGTTPVVISVLTNDTDNNIDATSVAIVSNGTHGTATVVNGTTDTISYTANTGFTGTDTFTYTVNDLVAQTSNVAIVTVTVNALNTPASSATFAVGTTAAAAGSTSGIVTLAQIGTPDTGTFPEDDMYQTCIGGCFDFVLSGVTGQATIVLPLSKAIPAKSNEGNNIVYRKFINGAWQSFDTTTDTYLTAPGTVTGTDVSCPPAGDIAYVGITPGHRCLMLTITDNGPNDTDATVGTVADPGGLGEITRVTGTDGCSMTGNSYENAADHADWWLLAGFVGLLGWFGMKRRKA